MRSWPRNVSSRSESTKSNSKTKMLAARNENSVKSKIRVEKMRTLKSMLLTKSSHKLMHLECQFQASVKDWLLDRTPQSLKPRGDHKPLAARLIDSENKRESPSLPTFSTLSGA